MAQRCLLFAPFWLLIDSNNVAPIFGETITIVVTIPPISAPARARRFPKCSVVVLQLCVGFLERFSTWNKSKQFLKITRPSSQVGVDQLDHQKAEVKNRV